MSAKESGGRTAEFFTRHFAALRVMGIIDPSGKSPEKVVAECNAAWSMGVPLVEVMLRGPDPWPAIRVAIAAGHEQGKPVGVGTIRSISDMDRAQALGADFQVSPAWKQERIGHAARQGIVYLPAVSGPAEIEAALDHGFTAMKAFPGGTVVTPQWIKQMLGPFPEAKFVVTGDVNANNARAYFDAGALAVGVGKDLRNVVGLMGRA